MKQFIEYKITTNRTVYNRIRKHRLEKIGELRCTWCSYHGGENSTNKWYGSKFNIKKFNAQIDELIEDVRFPSWKLTSKNSKQWMDKEIQITEKKRRTWRGGIDNHQNYLEIEF
jgi:hypothetical protein